MKTRGSPEARSLERRPLLESRPGCSISGQRPVWEERRANWMQRPGDRKSYWLSGWMMVLLTQTGEEKQVQEEGTCHSHERTLHELGVLPPRVTNVCSLKESEDGRTCLTEQASVTSCERQA